MHQVYNQENAVFDVLAKFKELKIVSSNEEVDLLFLPHEFKILTFSLYCYSFLKEIRHTEHESAAV